MDPVSALLSFVTIPLIFFMPGAPELPAIMVEAKNTLFVSMYPKSPFEERFQLQLICLLYVFKT